MQADFLLAVEACMEVFAFEHLRNGRRGGQVDHVRKAQLRQPLGVEANLGLFAVQDLEHLVLIGLGIGVDFFLGKLLARGGFARGVPNQRG